MAAARIGRLGPDRHARGAVRVGGGRGAGPAVVAGARRPLHRLVGPEHREAVSAPVPVVRAVVAARRRRGLHAATPRRAGSSAGRGSTASGPPAAGSGRRPVPSAGPRAAGRHPVRSGSSAVSSATRGSTSCSRRWHSTTASRPRSSVPGPESERLAAMADTLGIGDRVTFHGYVDEEPDPRRLSRVDVLAVPSLPLPGWIEQFGRVVVEAQASGVPVVASASGALPDVVGDAGAAGAARRPGRPARPRWPGSSTSPACGPGCGSRDRPRSPATRGRASPTPRWPSTGPVTSGGSGRPAADDRSAPGRPVGSGRLRPRPTAAGLPTPPSRRPTRITCA